MRSPISTLYTALVVANGALAAFPNVDFDRMGKVAIVGAFAGLDLFQNDTVAYDPATSTLFTRDDKGSLTRLASTNSGGRILAGCQLNDVFYFAGLFSSINGIDASNIASYSAKSNSFSPLASGSPNGEVETLYCDGKENKVWVGGSFSTPAAAVAVWNPSSQAWEKPLFGGLTGAPAKVSSITTNSSDASLFFAGSFATTFGSARQLNGTTNPNLPVSSGATQFSMSLVPIPFQSIRGADIDAASSNQAGFNNIRNVLCPSGDDGPGNSWFGRDGTTEVVTLRAFSFISATGIRLGNTFQDGRGTTSFSITTIPENNAQELRYVDPISGENQTCTDSCPLSTDSSVLYQDFLFNNAIPITGVEIRLTGFQGASTGLHILQVLSSGAFASAIEENNGISCYAPNPSNTTRTGDWVAKVANTNIPGTVQTVLVSSVDVGTPSSQGPTFTWVPYVSASGNYDINLLIPGCTNFQDCDRRTSVKVIVFPGDDLPPNVMTISQQNTEDSSILIYSGPILPSSPEFVTTVTMSLADDPAGNGGGSGRFEIVADRVQLILRSTNPSTLNPTDGGVATGGQRGFGFLEWPRSITTAVNGTAAFPNTSITALDNIGFDLLTGMGGTARSPLSVNAVAHHSSGTIFLGGNFTLSAGTANGAANIVAFKDGALVALGDGGLDNTVTSLVLAGDLLFVGGSFRDTRSGSTSGRLRGVAAYNVQSNTWTPLGAGVNGQVTQLGLTGGRVQVLGTFTELVDAGADLTIHAGGFATWDIESSSWVNPGGFTSGRMTLIANPDSSPQFVAGNVVSARKYGAAGMVFLQNGDAEGLPRVDPITAGLGAAQRPFATATDSLVVATPSSVAGRRHLQNRAKAWVSRVHVPRIFARQSSPTALAPLPALPASPAPAVLAGSFWTNGSAEVAILGGNFSFVVPGSSVARGIAIYHAETGAIRGLSGEQLDGTVRAILVDGDRLYVGGEITLANANVNGIAIYDLAKDAWDVSGLQPLQASAGSSVVVRSITKSASKSGTIIVSGSFAQAGSLRCAAICSFDVNSKQWNALGEGVQGEIASVAFAGDQQDVMFVGGSLMLSDNAAGNVLRYSFSNSSWTTVGAASELPGPVTAIELNNGNSSSVFAAGQVESGAPFLAFWDGSVWAVLDSTLGVDSNIAQLAMVPLQNTHDEQGVIQSDRVLMVSGSLVDSTHGNVSTALYDGKNFIPYIISSSLGGSSGSVASLFRSLATFSFDQRKFLAVGVVILISIAIAAGVVFLLALIGILWTLFSRQDERGNKYEGEENEDDSTHHRPSSLLEHINAATRTTILGASPYQEYSEKDDNKSRSDADPFAPDAGGFARAETPSDAMGGMMAEEMTRPAHARYSFDGNGEGELPISAGDELEVLDDRDPAWWYARHVRTGREGVVPAAYLY